MYSIYIYVINELFIIQNERTSVFVFVTLQ